MKIILSRKGFDSGSGGFPNPILPSGRLCMLPIPDKDSATQYRHIHFDDESLPTGMKPNLGSLVSQLTNRRVSPLRRAHLDPDLDKTSLERLPGWRPAFGQRGAALGHLQKQGVSPSDLFLFFGWFKQTELVCGRLRYVAEAPDLHVLFGWLQIGEILDLGAGEPFPDWALQHPHMQPIFQNKSGSSGNLLYIGQRDLTLPGLASRHAGAGPFRHFVPKLQLSSGDSLRSLWRLPGWFMPTTDRPPLTYHADPARWTRTDENDVLLRTVGRGQEFVLDAEAYPESQKWLQNLFDG